MKINEKIAAIRKTLRISRKEFASVTGLSPTSVYYFERKDRVPSPKSLSKIIDSFHLDPKRFLDGLEVSGLRRDIKLDVDEKWLRAHYLDYGMTTTAIAKAVGRSRSTVLAKLREYSIPRRPRFGRSGPQKPRSNADLISLLESKNPGALRLLNILTKDEREVITKRLSLADEEPKTLAYIGDQMGLTRERIRQIQNQALDKMQKFLNESKKKNQLNLSLAGGKYPSLKTQSSRKNFF